MPETLNIFSDFAKINHGLRDNNGDFNLLGRIDILYNPDKDYNNEEPYMIADHRIGFEEVGDAYVQVVHHQHNFSDAINMLILESEGKMKAMITTHFESSATGFSAEEAGNHPFVLSWRRFLDEQSKWLDKQHIDTLSTGASYPTILSVEDGVRLMRGWVAWLRKYGK